MTDQEIVHKIEEVLHQLRPNIQMDGGDIELIKFDNGIVYVKLHGACVGCPASQYTLKLGVEEVLKGQIAEVNEVIAISEE
jgi:Fe-S cluster biogenesis protein NfuA